MESNGKVRAISPGAAVITATVDGKQVKCKVNVKKSALQMNILPVTEIFSDVKEAWYTEHVQYVY